MTDNNERTELNNISPMNNVISPKHHSNEKEIDKVDEFTGDDLVVDILNDELISQVNDKLQGNIFCDLLIFYIRLSFLIHSLPQEITLSLEINLLNSLFLFNLTGASKELFESCFQSVKSYLAGEPFSEFECSMFFHR